MKIGIVCYPTFGGSGIVATELGMALAAKGHEVHYISSSQPVRLELLSERLFFHQVTVPDYPLFTYQPYELALSSKIVDIAKMNCLDLVHVHYAIPHAYAAYMAKQMLKDEGIYLPIVTTLHGTDITLVGQHPHYKPAVTFSINHSDYVTSVSESLRQDTLSSFDVKREIKVIPNFIDFKFYEDNSPAVCARKLLANDDERIITHISNFRKVKRITDVIEVFKRVNEEVPSRLLMIGEGPEVESSEDLAREYGLQDRVKFLGKSHEVVRLLKYSDLFILPSEKESFGLAALEAMAGYTPVISSNTGGLPEVNLHGQTGFLSRVGDIEDMSRNAIHILRDDQTLNLFKQKAYQRAQQFDMSKILPMYEAIYTEALENRLSLV